MKPLPVRGVWLTSPTKKYIKEVATETKNKVALQRVAKLKCAIPEELLISSRKNHLESTTDCSDEEYDDDLIDDHSFLEASDDDEFIVSSDDDDDDDFYPYCSPDEEDNEIAEMLNIEEDDELELVPPSDYEF